MYDYEPTIMIREQHLAPKLFILYNGIIRTIDLRSTSHLGRQTSKTNPEIAIDSSMKYVSRNHGLFIVEGNRVYYQDQNSANGTWYNNKKLEAGEPQQLKNGDVLRIFSKSNPHTFVTIIFATDYLDSFLWKVYPLAGKEQIEIGRGARSGLQLQKQDISRTHAVLFRHNNLWAIADRQSKNGLYINGIRLYDALYLKPGDTIRINNIYFVFAGDVLLYQTSPTIASESEFTSSAKTDPALNNMANNAKNALQIHIKERSVMQHRKKLTLLQDINMTIKAGEMVLILGGSGAGKTTFMNAVMGYEKADGRIMYGSTDVYSEYESMKYKIGFVPQQDLLRFDDRVIDTLNDAAKMKLKNLTDAEKEKRISTVLRTLGLERERENLVKKLSGGQRKRLSIAVEYIADPSLFFLDEPDSGLDGIMSRSLMENLRHIADEGKIVMVISHGPDRASDLFDKVIVLAKSVKDNSGHLAFFGSVKEAYSFFETDSLEGVVKRINRPDEGGDGLSDQYISKYANYRR